MFTLQAGGGLARTLMENGSPSVPEDPAQSRWVPAPPEASDHFLQTACPPGTICDPPVLNLVGTVGTGPPDPGLRPRRENAGRGAASSDLQDLDFVLLSPCWPVPTILVQVSFGFLSGFPKLKRAVHLGPGPEGSGLW
ncbi:uncharacterized protein RHO17_022604 isoform 1-T3 [Thomomys bottae]